MLKKRLLCMVLSALLALNTGLTALASEEALPGLETPGGAGDILEAFEGMEGLEVSIEEEPEGEVEIEEGAEGSEEAETSGDGTERFTGGTEKAEASGNEEELTGNQGETQVSEDEIEKLTGNLEDSKDGMKETEEVYEIGRAYV